MANQLDKIILFPRFTTFAGDRDWRTLPFNATAYQSGDVMAWIGDILGPTVAPVVTATFEESTDQVWWTPCGGTASATLTEGQETRLQPTFTKPWVRFTVNVQPGLDGAPFFSAYVVGTLERRKGARPPP